LGLSLSRQIIEAHHGSLTVADAVGGGSIFTIRLPSA
jgi:signal transduction histidine kinase